MTTNIKIVGQPKPIDQDNPINPYWNKEICLIDTIKEELKQELKEELLDEILEHIRIHYYDR